MQQITSAFNPIDRPNESRTEVLSRRVQVFFLGCAALGAVAALHATEGAPVARQNVADALPQAHFQALPFGAIRPQGWLRKLLTNDVQRGVFAYYDRSWQIQNQGFVLRGHNPNRDPKQPLIWDGAAEGYWGLALICSSVLTEDPAAKERADRFVEKILKSQDADGYVGIYDQETRYQPDTVDRDVHKGFLFEALLAYAQAYSRNDVLNAIERAVRCDMKHFNREAKGLWAKDFMVMSYPQFLERLAEVTNNKEYANYASFIVENYSAAPRGNAVFADCTLSNLLNPDRPFVGHACNTTGNLSLPWIEYYATGDRQYQKAGLDAFAKLERQLSISGSLPGDEDNLGRSPQPEIGIEFCSTVYLVENANLVGALTGESRYFDMAERALYNAGMGARLPDGTAHAYLKRDNEFNLDYPGIFHRYRYSPDHEPFCCTTRMMSMVPVFVGNMFKKAADGKGIAAVCFGPSTVRARLNGADVTIEEKTLYPFEDRVTFDVSTEKPTEFSFLIRIPTWSKKPELRCEGAKIARAGDYFVVTKSWGRNDQVEVTFNAEVKAVRWVNNEVALTCGPIVYAAKIDATPVRYDTFPSGRDIKDLSDGKLPIYGFAPGKNERVWEASLDGLAPGTTFGFKRVTVSTAHPDEPWLEPPVHLVGKMNRMRGKYTVSLVPMGCTVLRRVTFPIGYVYPSEGRKDRSMRDDKTSL